MNKFKFSVIMPIYNVEEFLDEAIQSVVNQTIGFKENIQLVLVNDGSPDNSHLICKGYKEKYPENIIYIEKENGGVSSARNRGLEVVEGEYINFLDPDDYLSLNVMSNVSSFFEENNVDLVSIPMFKFDAQVGEHQLNYKFGKDYDRVINIFADYKAIQLSGPSSFFRKSAIKHSFDENMKYAEDALFVNETIIPSGEYGALSKQNKYYYRKREDNSSATQSGEFDEDWYFGIIDKFFNSLIKISNEQYNHTIKYAQNMIMYDLGWRLNVEENEIMTSELVKKFLDKVEVLLKDIDEKIVNEQKHINVHKKRYLLDLKNDQAAKLMTFNKNVILYNGDRALAVLSKERINIEFINIEKGFVVLEGNFGSLFHKNDIEILAYTESGNFYPAEDVNRRSHDLKMLTIAVKEYKGFKIIIPIDDFVNVRIMAKSKQTLVLLPMTFGKYSGISNHFKQNYKFIGDYGIIHENAYLLTLKKKESKMDELKKEFKVVMSLFKTKKKPRIKAAIARIGYHLNMLFKKNEKWVFMDRQDKADDNAEHLFKYVTKNNKEIDAVFIVDKNSNDYTRLQQYGKVIPLGSYQHKMQMLLADKVISSHIDEWVINPFFSTKVYYQNLITFKFVFLQHGTIKDDLSRWLNRYRKNMSLFITGGKEEYKSIVNGDYNLTENEVVLSGFPRFDNLISDDKKQILIIPTWRKALVEERDQVRGVRPYSTTFKDSLFFNSYNDLINDPRLIEKAKEKNYEIIFFPHPDIQQQIEDFKRNDYVKFAPYDTPFQKMFNESSLLITDYSSVAFDFGYEKKPVIYYHFDEGNGYEKGYFDYKTMGFGEIIDNHEVLISSLINSLENDCEITEKYKLRIEDFYEHTDNNNCQRVYEAIKEMA